MAAALWQGLEIIRGASYQQISTLPNRVKLSKTRKIFQIYLIEGMTKSDSAMCNLQGAGTAIYDRSPASEST